MLCFSVDEDNHDDKEAITIKVINLFLKKMVLLKDYRNLVVKEIFLSYRMWNMGIKH